MIIKHWKREEYLKFVKSIQKVWNIHTTNTQIPWSSVESPVYMKGIGPVCKEVIRSQYRIGVDGFVTKVRLQCGGRKQVISRCFWKEMNMNLRENSPYMELYATMCASMLRHTKHIKSLAYCYGFLNGVLQKYTESAKYSQSETNCKMFASDEDSEGYIQRQNQAICLMSQEYLWYSFDDVVEIWKEDNHSDKRIRTNVLYMIQSVLQGLYWMEKEWGLHHNDLHLGNIRARKTKDGKFEWCIIDWGRATCVRPGVYIRNQVFMLDNGCAYGQLKQTKYALQPVSKCQYTNSASGGDIIGLIVALMREEYIRRAFYTRQNVLYPDVKWLRRFMPYPNIKGDGLHVFRKANEWAAKKNLTNEVIRKSLRIKLG